jgi:hypothetical protein
MRRLKSLVAPSSCLVLGVMIFTVVVRVDLHVVRVYHDMYKLISIGKI